MPTIDLQCECLLLTKVAVHIMKTLPLKYPLLPLCTWKRNDQLTCKYSNE